MDNLIVSSLPLSLKAIAAKVLDRLRELKDRKTKLDASLDELILHTQDLLQLLEMLQNNLTSSNRKAKISRFIANILSTVFMKSLQYQLIPLPALLAFAASYATHLAVGGILKTGASYMLHETEADHQRLFKTFEDKVEADGGGGDQFIEAEHVLVGGCREVVELLKSLYDDNPNSDPAESISAVTSIDSLGWVKVQDYDELLEYELIGLNAADMVAIGLLDEAADAINKFPSTYKLYFLTLNWKYEDLTAVKVKSVIEELKVKITAFKTVKAALEAVEMFKRL